MHLLENYREWLEHNGKQVMIDGHRYQIEASSYMATYPYKAEVLTVHAIPGNKRSTMYLKTHQELGDDWSIDILDSSLELQCSVLGQCRNNVLV